MTFDFETLNIFIYAFFALAAVSAVLTAGGVTMAVRRPAQSRRPSASLDNVVPIHQTMATHAPLPRERVA